MSNLYWPKDAWKRSPKKKAEKRRRKWMDAAKAAKDTLVLSHGFCLDGVTSAVIIMRAKPGAMAAYAQPSHVQDALHEISKVPGEGRQLIVADLSLQRHDFDSVVAGLKKLREAGWTVSWLDHHHKQWEGLDLTPLKAQLELFVIDALQKESGATLVQKQFASKDKFLKKLAETVRDRDLWWNKNPDSETLEFALTELGVEGIVSHFVNHDGKAPIVEDHIAAAAQRERDRQASEAGAILANARFWGEEPKKVGIAYGWLPRNTGLHELLTDYGCALAINVRPNGKMSIRSRKGADVSHLVAGRFDGGGHPNASGGDLGLSGARYWWYIVRRGKTNLAEQLAEVAMQELENV